MLNIETGKYRTPKTPHYLSLCHLYWFHFKVCAISSYTCSLFGWNWPLKSFQVLSHNYDLPVWLQLPAGAIIGGVFGSILLVLCLISAFCVTPYCICYVKKRKGSIVPTSPAVTLVAPHPTATTSSSTKPGTSHPTTEVSPYHSQPPLQPETYPTKPTAYPTKGQEPPPPYPGQAFEMQLVFKPVAGSYSLQPQEATHHNLRLYPPAEYPEQAAPYSTQAPKPNS